MAKKKTGLGRDSFFRDAGKPESPRSGKPQSRDAGKLAKATYRLDPDVRAHLEDVWFELRKETGQNLSRESIVEAALKMALAEYDEKKRDSWLWALIAKDQ